MALARHVTFVHQTEGLEEKHQEYDSDSDDDDDDTNNVGRNNHQKNSNTNNNKTDYDEEKRECGLSKTASGIYFSSKTLQNEKKKEACLVSAAINQV